MAVESCFARSLSTASLDSSRVLADRICCMLEVWSTHYMLTTMCDPPERGSR